MSKVIRIEKQHPETALENLNRLTGLDFQNWPESLLGNGNGIEPESPPEPQQGKSAAGHGRHAGGRRRTSRR